MTQPDPLLGLPSLVLFGLDFTLWPFYAHYLVPPIKKNKKGELTDSEGENVTCYPDVPKVFEELHKRGVPIAISTIGLEINISQKLLKLFDLDKYIAYKELNEVEYLKIIRKLRSKTMIQYSDMLFFDDCEHSLKLAAHVGVYTVHVKKGMNLDLLEEGLYQFQVNRTD